MHVLICSLSFVADSDRLFSRDFLPNNQDILRARLQTTKITEAYFSVGQIYIVPDDRRWRVEASVEELAPLL